MGGSVVGTHEVQAEVHAGRRSGTGGDVTVIHVQHPRVHLDLREPGRQLGGPGPVRGGPPAVQQPGGGEHEGARADGDDARTRSAGQRDRPVQCAQQAHETRLQEGAEFVEGLRPVERPAGDGLLGKGHPGPGGHEQPR